jgi:hypothetical protein
VDKHKFQVVGVFPTKKHVIQWRDENLSNDSDDKGVPDLETFIPGDNRSDNKP